MNRGYERGKERRNFQEQQYISKQEVAQIQDLELSIDTMCRVLTLAEKYALGYNEKYGAYNMSSAKGEDLLRLFVREIEIYTIAAVVSSIAIFHGIFAVELLLIMIDGIFAGAFTLLEIVGIDAFGEAVEQRLGRCFTVGADARP